jgi:hypothetical protein
MACGCGTPEATYAFCKKSLAGFIDGLAAAAVRRDVETSLIQIASFRREFFSLSCSNAPTTIFMEIFDYRWRRFPLLFSIPGMGIDVR